MGKEKNKDLIFYYVKVLKYLKKFLGSREIAVKNYIPDGPILLKRGSKLGPLYVDEILKYANKNFLETRKKIEHLKGAKKHLNKIQIKIWEYFLPRKLCELHYATNHEGPNKPIDRIFIDIDRTKRSLEDARIVTLNLLNLINKDKDFKNKIVEHKELIQFTGRSFHIFLLLKKTITKKDYNEIFSSKTGIFNKICKEVNKETPFEVVLGHIRTMSGINIDPSQTPSGKLARAPFSLHIKDAKTIDGVTIPLTEKILKNKKEIENLTSYTMEGVLKNIEKLAKRIPILF